MASIINASNSGAGGLISAGDASGVLALQTAGTTAITVDTSQNVGIGTTNPVGSNRKLEVGLTSATTNYIRLNASGSGSALYESLAVGAAAAQFGVNATASAIAGIAAGTFGIGSTDVYALTFGTNNTERMRIDASGNLLVGTTSQIKSSKQSIYSGATNATTYNTTSFQGGSVLTVQNQQTTSVSTSAVTIANTNIYATLALVYGSDGTNRFQDLIMFGLATGTVNVINSFTVGGSPASRTYSQSSSTYRLAMGSGTYTIQFSGLSQGD